MNGKKDFTDLLQKFEQHKTPCTITYRFSKNKIVVVQSIIRGIFQKEGVEMILLESGLDINITDILAVKAEKTY